MVASYRSALIRPNALASLSWSLAGLVFLQAGPQASPRNGVPASSPSAFDLSVTLAAAPDPVPPGAIVTYTVQLYNAGPSTAKSVVVRDTLPSATTFVSCSATAGGVCGGGSLARKVSYGSLAAGASSTITLQARVKSNVVDGKVITNRARVAPRSGDVALANNTASISVVATRRNADLAVSLEAGPDPVTSGAAVTYTMTVTNAGPTEAGSVTVTDALPESATFVSCATTGGANCTVTGNTVVASFASFPVGASSTVSVVAAASPPTPPYPASPVLAGAVFDLGAIARQAPGSDLWPITWGSDDNLYGGWGDGGGFGGTNSDGRVSVGFARIAGFPPDVEGRNLWGGKNSPSPATFTGKPTGMVSCEGVLSAWILEDGGAPGDVRLARSFDLSQTWELESWSFPGVAGGFYPLTFLNFGRDNAGARDGFVHVYGKSWSAGPDPHASAESYLARVPPGALNDRGQYEFFAGTDGADPLWTTDPDQAAPVLSDPDGIDAPSVVYHPGLQRYLAVTAHHQEVQKLAIFDAPEPWGPWTTVVYHDNWGEWGPGESLGYALPAKWIDPGDGTLWMVFSSGGDLDAFNLVPGTLVLRPLGSEPGTAATRLRNTVRVRSSVAFDPSLTDNAATAEIGVVD